MNFSVAVTAARAYLGELDADAVARAAAEVRVPGRLQVLSERPLTLLDGAHNPAGMAALAQSLRTILAERGQPGLVAVVSILDDKDAAGMLAALLPLCEGLILTRTHNPRVLPPPTLQSLASQLGGPAGRRSCPTRAPRLSARASSRRASTAPTGSCSRPAPSI